MTERLTRDEFLAALASGRKDFSGCDLSGLDLRRADLSGADLRRADLRRADLRRADLRRADLSGAILRDVRGLYSACPSFMFLRYDALYAGVFERDGELVLLFDVGCKAKLTADEMRAAVRETHGDNAHAVQYLAAIAFIEACVASDLAAGRFETKETQS